MKVVMTVLCKSQHKCSTGVTPPPPPRPPTFLTHGCLNLWMQNLWAQRPNFIEWAQNHTLKNHSIVLYREDSYMDSHLWKFIIRDWETFLIGWVFSQVCEHGAVGYLQNWIHPEKHPNTARGTWGGNKASPSKRKWLKVVSFTFDLH